MINTNDPTLYEPLQRQLVLPLFFSSTLWGSEHEFNPHLPLLYSIPLLLFWFYFFVSVFHLSASDHFTFLYLQWKRICSGDAAHRHLHLYLQMPSLLCSKHSISIQKSTNKQKQKTHYKEFCLFLSHLRGLFTDNSWTTTLDTIICDRWSNKVTPAKV